MCHSTLGAEYVLHNIRHTALATVRLTSTHKVQEYTARKREVATMVEALISTIL